VTRLAHLFGHDDPDALLAEYRGYTQENRRRFDRIFDRAAREC
jgi:hypothetical protein